MRENSAGIVSAARRRLLMETTMKKMKIPTAHRRGSRAKMPLHNVRPDAGSASFRLAEQSPSSPFKSGMPVSDNDAARCCSHYLISRSKRRRMTR